MGKFRGNWEKLGNKLGGKLGLGWRELEELAQIDPNLAEIGRKRHKLNQKSAQNWGKSEQIDPNRLKLGSEKGKSGKRGGGTEGTAPVHGQSINQSIDRSAGPGSIHGGLGDFPSLPRSFPAGFGAKRGDFGEKIGDFGTHRGPEQSGRNRK